MLKNITLSADSRLIEEARQRAQSEKQTLNQLFREWLKQYTGRGGELEEYRQLMSELSHVTPGRSFSREEMNER